MYIVSTEEKKVLDLFNSLNDKQLLFLEYAMLQMPQVDYTTTNYLSDGIYTRQLDMPKGSFVIGKEHIHEHTLNVVLKGQAIFVDGEGYVKTITAPAMFISDNGKKKFGFFTEDTTWLTIHKTDKTNLDDIEKELFITPDYQGVATDYNNLVESLKVLGGQECQLLPLQ